MLRNLTRVLAICAVCSLGCACEDDPTDLDYLRAGQGGAHGGAGGAADRGDAGKGGSADDADAG
jgi:hypothetical protein